MPTPVLIDTDMGVDDAVAVALALAAPQLEVAGLVSVGGNVDVDQATANLAHLLEVAQPSRRPILGKGLDQRTTGLLDARWLFGRNGLGEVTAGRRSEVQAQDFRSVYQTLLEQHSGKLVVIAIGPLTNLAAVHRETPDLLARAARIVIMGGAVFAPGNVGGVAEFNFYRDPEAAREVLSAGLPCTVAPLDATRQVILDESHVARLAAAGTPTGDLLAAALRFPMMRGRDVPEGRFIVHDALAVGVLLWPEVFIQTRIGLRIDPDSDPPGRSRPAVSHDKSKLVSVLLSVQAADFLENLLETLCRQRFVV